MTYLTINLRWYICLSLGNGLTAYGLRPQSDMVLKNGYLRIFCCKKFHRIMEVESYFGIYVYSSFWSFIVSYAASVHSKVNSHRLKFKIELHSNAFGSYMIRQVQTYIFRSVLHRKSPKLCSFPFFECSFFMLNHFLKGYQNQQKSRWKSKFGLQCAIY